MPLPKDTSAPKVEEPQLEEFSLETIFPDQSWKDDDLKERLFELAKKLEIIPPDFNKEDFFQRFFYLFIERANQDSRPFGENQFGPAYKTAMLRAFYVVFKLTEHNRESGAFLLDANMVHQFHLLSCRGVLLDIGIDFRGYRTSAGFQPHQVSHGYLDELAGNEGKIFLELLEYDVGPCHTPPCPEGDVREGYIGLRYEMDYRKPAQIIKTMEMLCEVYWENLERIDLQELSADQKKEEKLKLIGTMVADIARFHPYNDGNGRLAWFLLLNYLLINEGLTPALAYQPWHFPYALESERVAVLKENQIAWQEFFIEGKKLNEKNRLIALTPEAANISFLFSEEKQEIEFFQAGLDIYAYHFQLKHLNSRLDLDENEREKLRQSLQEKIAKAIKIIDDSGFKKIEEYFFFPMQMHHILESVVLRAVSQFVRVDESEEMLRWQRNLLKEKFAIDLDNPANIPELAAKFAYRDFKELNKWRLPKNSPPEIQTAKGRKEFLLNPQVRHQILEKYADDEKYSDWVKAELIYSHFLQSGNLEDKLSLPDLRQEMKNRGILWFENFENLAIDLGGIGAEYFPQKKEAMLAFIKNAEVFNQEINPDIRFPEAFIMIKKVLQFADFCRGEYCQREAVLAQGDEIAPENPKAVAQNPEKSKKQLTPSAAQIAGVNSVSA